MDWMTRHIAPDEFCVVTDVSGAFATISVMGPQSRELLALTGTPASLVPCSRPAPLHHICSPALLLPALLGVWLMRDRICAGRATVGR